MSKPISRAEMKDWVNETWQKCQDEGGIMTDYERGFEQGKADVKKQWVGLTDEEVQNIMEKTVAKSSELDDISGDTARLFVKNIEAKLKEKNA